MVGPGKRVKGRRFDLCCVDAREGRRMCESSAGVSGSS